MKRGLPFVIFLFVLLIAALAVYIDWTWKRKLSPHGGRYFFHRVELAVPWFRQSDEKWRDDPLGGIVANGTLGGEGCAIFSCQIFEKVRKKTSQRISSRHISKTDCGCAFRCR